MVQPKHGGLVPLIYLHPFQCSVFQFSCLRSVGSVLWVLSHRTVLSESLTWSVHRYSFILFAMMHGSCFCSKLDRFFFMNMSCHHRLLKAYVTVLCRRELQWTPTLVFFRFFLVYLPEHIITRLNLILRSLLLLPNGVFFSKWLTPYHFFIATATAKPIKLADYLTESAC